MGFNLNIKNNNFSIDNRIKENVNNIKSFNENLKNKVDSDLNEVNDAIKSVIPDEIEKVNADVASKINNIFDDIPDISLKHEDKSTVSNNSSSSSSSSSSSNSGEKLNTVNGRIYYNGHYETYYSTQEPGQNVTAREIPGKHVASDGTIRDKDGYICLAMPLDVSERKKYGYDYGDVVMTSLGAGKIYDCGTVGNTIDIYTNWDV